MTIELSEYVIDAIAAAVVKKMQDPSYNSVKTELEPCEDCISRQIISDYVGSHIQEINTGYGDLNKHTNEILRMIVNYIDSMPPVTPQPCDDAISRQAALDCFTATKLKKFDFILYAREEIKKLPSVTPQPKMGRWIPCSERLPEVMDGTGGECSDDVLICVADDENITISTGFYGYYPKSASQQGWWSMWTYGCHQLDSKCKVVAWMALPQKYKEEIPTGAESEG